MWQTIGEIDQIYLNLQEIPESREQFGHICQLVEELDEQVPTNKELFGERLVTLSSSIHAIIATFAICSPNNCQTVSISPNSRQVFANNLNTITFSSSNECRIRQLFADSVQFLSPNCR